LTEIPNNLIDDNLNGVIDENYLLHVERIRFEFDPVTQQIRDLPPQPPLAYIDYIQLARQNPTGIPAGSNLLDPIEINRTIYPMIDERRDDGFDNNKNDDGRARSLDATDVVESDQIGLSSFALEQNASFDVDDIDEMVTTATPGRFDRVEVLAQAQSADYMYSAGFFPLPAGQTERFSIGLGFGTDAENILQVYDIVLSIYNANYNFARPPTTPTVKAYTDDRRVTLYWDDVAEDYRDEFIRRSLTDSLGVPLFPPNTDNPRIKNFEGYKIIKATDNRFADALTITGSRGEEAQQYVAYAQYDLINDVRGNFPLVTQELLNQSRGIAYYLGNNTGLVHTFTDSNVVNGRTYFYGVLAYNRGDTALGLYPAESPLSAADDGRGNFILGTNVVAVTPQPKVAGFAIPSTGGNAEPVVENGIGPAGNGAVRYSILDPKAVGDKRYEIQFFDTSKDTTDNDGDGVFDQNDYKELRKTTSYFTVIDITNSQSPDTLIRRNRRPMDKTVSYTPLDATIFNADDEIFDGISLTIQNDIVPKIDTQNTKWNRPEINKYKVQVLSTDTAGRNYFTSPTGAFVAVLRPDDYEIQIVPFGAARSDTVRYFRTNGAQSSLSQSFIGRETNFIIRNLSTGDTARYFLSKRSGQRIGADNVEIGLPFLQQKRYDEFGELRADTAFLWTFTFDTLGIANAVAPQVGDRFAVRFFKPFREGDRFRITTAAASVDNSAAKNALDRVNVVPNPYIARSQYERPLPVAVTRGRGERVIRFTRVPKGSTIRIYTIRGDLVQTLVQDGSTEGDVRWNLRSRENLDVAYGLYLYHLDAPGIGAKTGKFVLIK
jgi:hypothetical protein